MAFPSASSAPLHAQGPALPFSSSSSSSVLINGRPTSRVSCGPRRRPSEPGLCHGRSPSPLAPCQIVAKLHQVDPFQHKVQERSEIEPKKTKVKIGVVDNLVTDGPLVLSSSRLEGNSAPPPPPLVSALKAAAEQNVASFHFPGHNRGRAAPSSLAGVIGIDPFRHDLPELPELDNLFCPEGPILDAQKQAAELFGSSETWFLVGGTTCGIHAAIMATCSPGDTLILPRNSHLSATSAMVLSGVVPKYIMPEYNSEWGIAGSIDVAQLEKALSDLESEGRKAAAVFVTSPTYEGVCSNIYELSQLSHSHGIPLIVDEAHGAHLGFHSQLPASALQQGADISVQSTHKVLCSLTQSSMLHMAGNIVDRERICKCLQTLMSTSPSYLLLASLDAARAQLSENPGAIFHRSIDLAVMAKELLEEVPGVTLLDSSSFPNCSAMDPLRLTVGFWQLGMSGYEADEILDRDHGIVCELVGSRYMTFTLNLGTHKEHIQRLVSGIKHLSAASAVKSFEGTVNNGDLGPFVDIEMAMSPRDAFFMSKRKAGIEECPGKICGELICPYPPGIPLLIPGEIITEQALDYLKQVKKDGTLITGASDPLLSSLIVCNK
ncbi:arginine decarboxylase isoform X2 [Eucalyptus grandis]|uniref:arginine decarboxylase isoform X2 n=1 Tax=Eucalyptus grandis TaxID=71139 RepID=UPI00192E9A0D|nr:arginine decarboxylase isoform X2 [Eucalyptus grandis]